MYRRKNVQIDHEVSKPCFIRLSVPQSSILGLLFFPVNIKDLVREYFCFQLFCLQMIQFGFIWATDCRKISLSRKISLRGLYSFVFTVHFQVQLNKTAGYHHQHNLRLPNWVQMTFHKTEAYFFFKILCFIISSNFFQFWKLTWTTSRISWKKNKSSLNIQKTSCLDMETSTRTDDRTSSAI